jgi:mannose-6-phosphate isomerase
MTTHFEEALKLAPRLDAKPWGGRRLAQWGKQLPDGPIGEALESGNAAIVVNGPYAGRTLGELARAFPDELLGSRGRAVAGAALDFPLLVKLIDAREHLSVQVHPGDTQAPAGKRGKSEAWLILEAEPGAELITGLRGPLRLDDLEAQLTRREAHAGDVYLVPPGTVHAIGAGVLLYEIQQPSDVTYRVYDWGRQRELHVDDVARVARADGQMLHIEPQPWRTDAQLLVACPYFALERRDIAGGQLEAMPASCRVLTLQEGTLEVGGVPLTKGDSIALPATLAAQPVTDRGVALIAWAPDLERDIAAPLRAAGVAPARIAELTGTGLFEG